MFYIGMSIFVITEVQFFLKVSPSIYLSKGNHQTCVLLTDDALSSICEKFIPHIICSSTPPWLSYFFSSLSTHHEVFVDDLSPEVNDEVLVKAFAAFGLLADA